MSTPGHNKLIRIACAASRSHIPHAATMLSSLFANNPGESFEIYLLHDQDVTAEDIATLDTLTAAHLGRLIPLQPDEEVRGKVPISARFGAAAWFRVLLPELLLHVDRVLYLDVDLLVLDSIAPLWRTDLGDKLIGAVTNPLYPGMSEGSLATLKVRQLADYFNSGVLLMDLAGCRRAQITSQVLSLVTDNPHLARFADQDPLNLALGQERLALPLRWNVQATIYDLPIWWLKRYGLDADAIRQARRAPAVLHYSGAWKPWEYRCNHPRRELYAQYRRTTPWSEWSLEGRNALNSLLRQVPAAWQIGTIMLRQRIARRIRRATRKKWWRL